MSTQRLVIFVSLLALGGPWPVSAQGVGDPVEQARFHLGPVAITPKFGVRNVGLDTNVFNAAETPERDFTATFTSGADTWLRVGRAFFSSKTSVDWIYFQKASSQRSVNFNQEGRVDVDLLRFVPRLGGTFLNTRQRPNDEVDVRVQQRHVGVNAGVSIPVGSRVHVDLDWWRTTYDYAQGEFGNAAIATALNRESRVGGLAASVELTPLTMFVVRADTRQDRFTFSTERNSDSFRVMPGFKFEPTAIISGSAFVGYRKFDTPSLALPDFGGLVASVELKFVALDMFRITGQVNRDVEYSLDLGESYFVSTTAGVEVTQAIGLYWDVVGRIRRATLAYQQPTGGTGRVDRAVLAGTGLGRRLGTDMRVGFDVDYVRRQSAVGARAYDGFRFGGSVTYGY